MDEIIITCIFVFGLVCIAVVLAVSIDPKSNVLSHDWKCTQYTEWRIYEDSQERDCIQFTKQKDSHEN